MFNKINKSCIILLHQGAGDCLTFYGLVRIYQIIYNKVYIFSLERNRNLMNQLYEDYININIINIQRKEIEDKIPDEDLLMLENYIKNNNEEYDIIATGSNKERTHVGFFWNYFYRQANLDYSIRYSFPLIKRNMKRELDLYNKVISIYGVNYVFVHDHRSIYNEKKNKRNNVSIKCDLPIFHPNINYYIAENDNDNLYNNLWTHELSTNNILDYCLVIENCKGLFLNDSCFSCLVVYLDTSRIIEKRIYSPLNFPEYHNSFRSGWNLIRN